MTDPSDKALAEARKIVAEWGGYPDDDCVPVIAHAFDEITRLRAEVERLRAALADAICRPKGVVLDSAAGLIFDRDLMEAEGRRAREAMGEG